MIHNRKFVPALAFIILGGMLALLASCGGTSTPAPAPAAPEAAPQPAPAPPPAAESAAASSPRDALAKGSKTFQGKVVPYTLTFDKETWRESGTQTAPKELQLDHASGKAFIFTIAEGATLSYELLKFAVLSNIESAGGTETELLREEAVEVNGTEYLFLELRTNLKGVKLRYLYLLYTGSKGTLQVIGGALEDSYEAHEDEVIEILNSVTLQTT
jgi:hypothetical protein